MTAGPGKYDEIATQARELAQARGVVVLVLNGKRGSGFSVQVPANLMPELPGIFRQLAEQIEAELREGPSA